jgi:hypothetical protein
MSLTKTGTGWLESRQLKVGDKLVAVDVIKESPELTRGTIYEVFPSSGRSSLAIKTDKGNLANLGAYSITTFYKKESTMVDWSKPIKVSNWNLFLKFLGTINDLAFIETVHGTIYKADVKTGVVYGISNAVVTNQLEPWEEAWLREDRYGYDTQTYKEVFRLGFNAGVGK